MQLVSCSVCGRHSAKLFMSLRPWHLCQNCGISLRSLSGLMGQKYTTLRKVILDSRTLENVDQFTGQKIDNFLANNQLIN